MKREAISLGRWSEGDIDLILKKSFQIKNTGRRISFISGKFLGIPYRESTLIGDEKIPEVFVIDFTGVDCFTFLDYIEAMRLSKTFEESKGNLKRVRYKKAKVGFKNRNHFFSDWAKFNPRFVEDVTKKIGKKKARRELKMLNLKKDGACFVPGIKPAKRVIKYIPSDAIDSRILRRLKTGDYIGIYSKAQGLDVSHAGILIKAGGEVYLRHASSVKKKVVDEDFKKYIAGKPGIVVYRGR